MSKVKGAVEREAATAVGVEYPDVKFTSPSDIKQQAAQVDIATRFSWSLADAFLLVASAALNAEALRREHPDTDERIDVLQDALHGLLHTVAGPTISSDVLHKEFDAYMEAYVQTVKLRGQERREATGIANTHSFVNTAAVN